MLPAGQAKTAFYADFVGLSFLSRVQIQPMKVMTRKGYAKKGSGDDVGSNGSPQNILADVMAKRSEVAIPIRRTAAANSFGMLISKSAVAHRAVPAAKDGTLPARPAAVPESMTASPIAKTRKPAATKSIPCRKNFKASKAPAITKPRLSMAQKVA